MVKKNEGIVYRCRECGHTASKWAGQCPSCQQWGTLEESVAPMTRGGKVMSAPLQQLEVTGLSRATGSAKSKPRISSGLAEVDRVLGGGIVPGSIILLAGAPGIGKSTLLLQLAASVGSRGRVLYISGEESADQVAGRAERLSAAADGIEFAGATQVEAIADAMRSISYDLVIVDSVQMMHSEDSASAPGSVGQITAVTHVLQLAAKSTNTATLLVGHITKEGSIAGPRVLEHLVDVVLNLEGERVGGYRMLYGVKNRFGATNEVGVFEMHDRGLQPVEKPSQALLQQRATADGSVVLPTLEGTRALLVEVQALVSRTVFGYPRRTATGFDTNRLHVLLAVLERRAGVSCSDYDVFVNVVGGLKVSEPAADLAIAMAIASARLRTPVPEDVVVFGELGLGGEVRGVAHSETRIKEAASMEFRGAWLPNGNANKSESVAIQLHAVSNLKQAVTGLKQRDR